MARLQDNVSLAELVVGSLLGFAIAVVIFALGEPNNGAVDFVKNYQTLITGLLAIFAAALTIWTTRLQINQAELHRQDGLDRTQRAVRAILPLSLARLSQYATDSVVVLRKIYEIERDNPEEIPPSRDYQFSTPILPEDVIAAIRDNIEYGNVYGARELSLLVRRLQIQNSRLKAALEDLREPNSESLILRTNIEQFIIDALEISLRCSLLYDYARGDDDLFGGNLSSEKLINTAHSFGMWDDYERVFETIRARFQNDKHN